MPDQGEFLRRPVGQAIKPVAGRLKFVQDFNSFRDDPGDGFLPFFIVGADEMGILRELCREVLYGLGKGIAFILGEIPGGEIDFGQNRRSPACRWRNIC